MWEGFQAQISPYAPSESPHCKVTCEYCKYFSQIYLSLRRVYFGVSKAPWRLSTTRPGVSLTLCSTSLCLSKLFFESFSCDLEQQVEESLPPAFLSPLGILRKYEKWDCNNETSFSTRSHEGVQQPRLCCCIWLLVCQFWGMVWTVRGTFCLRNSGILLIN